MVRARTRRIHPQLCKMEDRTTPSAGWLDPTFSGDGKATIACSTGYAVGNAIAVDSVGRIVIAGYSWDGSKADMFVCRLSPAGAPDMAFGIGGKTTISFGQGNSYASGVALDSLDRIVIVGEWYNGSTTDFAVARLNTDGALDPNFDSDGTTTVDFGFSEDSATAVTIDSKGRIVVAGYSYDGITNDFAVARLTKNGLQDTAFHGDGRVTIAVGTETDNANSVAVDSQDRVIVAGYSYDGSNPEFSVTRLTSDGEVDSAFATDGRCIFAFGGLFDQANSVAVDSQDRPVIAGLSFNGITNDFAVARLTPFGAFDASFDGDGKATIDFGTFDDSANGLAIDVQGRIVLCGTVTSFSGVEFASTRLTASGQVDVKYANDGKARFGFGTTNQAHGVAIDTAGRAIIVGHTTTADTEVAVARLTGETTLAVPQVNGGSIQRSRVTSLEITFSGQVTFVGPTTSAFSLTRSGSGPVNFSATTSVVDGGTVVTLNGFSGTEAEYGSLVDGRYSLNIFADQIAGGAFDGNGDGTPGDDYVLIGSPANGLFRLFGDADGNGTVNTVDFNAFRSAYGGSNPIFDFDNAGGVGTADFNQFRQRFGSSV